MKVYKDKNTKLYYVEGYELDETDYSFLSYFFKDILEENETKIMKNVGTESEMYIELKKDAIEFAEKVAKYYKYLSKENKENIKTILKELNKLLKNIENPFEYTKKEEKKETKWCDKWRSKIDSLRKSLKEKLKNSQRK